jgi:hypothetical protein
VVPVSFYIDGFNLYHALLRFRDPKVEWLDIPALCKRLIQPKTEEIKSIKYFSAFAHWLPDPMARHQEYVRALEASGVIAIMTCHRTFIQRRLEPRPVLRPSAR